MERNVRTFAWVYARVSSKEQAVDGSSLPVQSRECCNWCESQGLTMGSESNYNNPGVFADPGVSAWKISLFSRPGFQKLWCAMKPGDTVVFLSLDRAFRSVMDFSTSWPKFEAAGIIPVFLRDRIDMRTATGRLMAHMCASFAQFKSDMISQRVREGKRIKRERPDIPEKSRLVQQDNPALGKLAAEMNDVIPLQAIRVDRGRVFGYTRVSTTEQTAEVQYGPVNSIIGRFVDDGYEDGGDLFEDHGVSAFSVDWRDRPAGKLLWEQLQPNDCIVISRLDRAFRSVHDMANTTKHLIERGVHLVTACGLDTRTETGRQGIEILSLVAAWESRDMSWRLRLALAHASKLRGKWLSKSRVPRWMKIVDINDTHWTTHPNMEVIEQFREVQQMREEGLSRKEISDYMEERLSRRHGRPMLPPIKFNPRTIRCRLLRTKVPRPTIDRYDQWVKEQTPDKNGDVEREWSWQRTNDAMNDFKMIDKVLEATEGEPEGEGDECGMGITSDQLWRGMPVSVKAHWLRGRTVRGEVIRTIHVEKYEGENQWMIEHGGLTVDTFVFKQDGDGHHRLVNVKDIVD